jgi:hypothetical protein
MDAITINTNFELTDRASRVFRAALRREAPYAFPSSVWPLCTNAPSSWDLRELWPSGWIRRIAKADSLLGGRSKIWISTGRKG